MIEAIAVRRFNDGGREYAAGESLTLDRGAFDQLRAIGLVRRAGKVKRAKPA